MQDTQLFTINENTKIERECQDIYEVSMKWLYDHLTVYLKDEHNNKIKKKRFKTISALTEREEKEAKWLENKDERELKKLGVEYIYYKEKEVEMSIFDAASLILHYVIYYYAEDKDSIKSEGKANELAKAAFRIYAEILPDL